MPSRCRNAHLFTEKEQVSVAFCALPDAHTELHESRDGWHWETGIRLPFHRLGDGYAAATSTRAFAAFSNFHYWKSQGRSSFTWDLVVRDLTAAPGIRHRAAAPQIHHGRYCRRMEAYDVALAYSTLGDGFEAGDVPEIDRWAWAHHLTDVPLLDVPPGLEPDDPGPDPRMQ